MQTIFSLAGLNCYLKAEVIDVNMLNTQVKVQVIPHQHKLEAAKHLN